MTDIITDGSALEDFNESYRLIAAGGRFRMH